MADHVHVEISTATIFKTIAMVLAFILLYILKDVLVIFLFAIIVASAVSPFVGWLEGKGLPRIFGVLFLYLVVFGLIVLVSSLVIPSVSQDLSQMAQLLPRVLQQVSSSLDTVQKGAPKYFDFIAEIQNVLDVLSGYLQQFSQSALSLVVSIFGGVFSFMAIIVISFYLAVMKKGIESFLAALVPSEYEGYAISLWKRSEHQVGRWLQGQLLLSLIMGLVVYVGLSLLHIKFALLLGLLIMLLEIVPVAGPVLAAIPAIALGFLQSPMLGVWVLIFYVIIQQVENHALVPLVLGKTTGLNPVVVIIALLVGSSLAGIPGAILSVPVATIIVEILDDLAKHKEMRRQNA